MTPERNLNYNEGEGNRLNYFLHNLESVIGNIDHILIKIEEFRSFKQKSREDKFFEINHIFIDGIYNYIGLVFSPLNPNTDYQFEQSKGVKEYTPNLEALQPTNLQELPTQTIYEIKQFHNTKGIDNTRVRVMEMTYISTVETKSRTTNTPRRLTLVTTPNFFHIEDCRISDGNRVVILCSPRECQYVIKAGSKKNPINDLQGWSDENMVNSRAYLINGINFTEPNSIYKEYLNDLRNSLINLSNGIRALIRT